MMDLDLPDDEEFSRFFDEMDRLDPLIVMVLKGHVLIEERLRLAVTRLVRNPLPALKEMKFNTLLNLLRMLSKDEEFKKCDRSLKNLDNIRNDVAHNIEVKDFHERIRQLIVEVSKVGVFTVGTLSPDPIEKGLRYTLACLWAVADLVTD